MRALSHPLRLRMLELLRTGPATATQLARELGESSYHLRELEKAGLVEEETERGNERDRWWKRTTPLFVVGSDPADDAEYDAAPTQLRGVFVERDEKGLGAYFATVAAEPQQWQDVSTGCGGRSASTPTRRGRSTSPSACSFSRSRRRSRG